MIKLSLDLCFPLPRESVDVFRLGLCWDFPLPLKNANTTKFYVLLGILSDA